MAEDLNSDVAKLPTLHVEATRTDTGYLQTPASVFRIETPQVDSSSQVNLTEVVKGIPSLQIRNRENYAQDLQLSMRGFGTFYVWCPWYSSLCGWYPCNNARWAAKHLIST